MDVIELPKFLNVPSDQGLAPGAEKVDAIADPTFPERLSASSTTEIDSTKPHVGAIKQKTAVAPKRRNKTGTKPKPSFFDLFLIMPIPYTSLFLSCHSWSLITIFIVSGDNGWLS
jgi:hypothetical protein